MTQRMRVCNVAGCGATQTTPRCPTHTRTTDKARGTRQQRGYDAAHDTERARLLPLAYGKPCPHCTQRMWPHDKLHLDHTDDRKGYIGIVHEACNTSRAASAGNTLRTTPHTLGGYPG